LLVRADADVSVYHGNLQCDNVRGYTATENNCAG
jgi:hypothetical protein